MLLGIGVYGRADAGAKAKLKDPETPVIPVERST